MSETDTTDDGEGGKSFAELKDEYESGDAEWADEVDSGGDDEDDAEREADDTPDGGDSDGDAVETELDEELLEEDPDEELADDDLFDEVIEDEDGDGDAPDATGNDDARAGTDADAGVERPDTGADTDPEPEPASDPDPDPDPEPDPEPESGATTDGAATGAGERGAPGGRPYLGTLPDGFAADLVVIEWLEYLVDEVGVRETARAIDYYETIDWIAEPVGEDLQDYLRGFEDRDGGADGLTIDHHTRSLQYISQLDGGGAGSVLLSELGGHRGGGLDGIQR